MIERVPNLDRNDEYDTQKSSPTRSEDTHDSYSQMKHYFLPVPFFVLVPTPTTFFHYSIHNPISEFDIGPSHNIQSDRPLIKQDVKVEMVEEINFISKIQKTDNSDQNGQQKSEYCQNEYRNVIPNLIRLILNFSLIREKSQKYLKLVFPDLSSEEINMYYKYARRLKTNGSLSKNPYVSEKKLKDILGVSNSQYFGSRCVRKRTKNEQFYKQIMRTLAMYYLNNLCIEVILHSNKMRKQLKMAHLSRRNRLISILRRGDVQNDINTLKL